MTEKTTKSTNDMHRVPMEAAEHVAKTMFGAMNGEWTRMLDEMQKAQERVFIEGERMVVEQQKLFDNSMKMGRAMSSAYLESARRITGSMG